MDLGVHLVDLALWLTGFPAATVASAALFAGGELLRHGDDLCEDYAEATLTLTPGIAVRLACSWRLHAGRDAVIEVAVRGTKGGATFRNVNGSFYDFVAEHHRGTSSERLCEPPDAWGGRAVQDWCERLAAGERFDARTPELVQVSEVIDQIYVRAARD